MIDFTLESMTIREEYRMTRVVINFQVEGIHNWPDCPFEDVKFLKSPHRHMFHIELTKDVSHDDRDIEIIRLKRKAIRELHNLNEVKDGMLIFGSKSCETIAKELCNALEASSCKVLEDGENGAIFTACREVEKQEPREETEDIENTEVVKAIDKALRVLATYKDSNSFDFWLSALRVVGTNGPSDVSVEELFGYNFWHEDKFAYTNWIPFHKLKENYMLVIRRANRRLELGIEQTLSNSNKEVLDIQLSYDRMDIRTMKARVEIFMELLKVLKHLIIGGLYEGIE